MLDGIFNEVAHIETLGISNNEALRLFYLKVRGKKIYTDNLQTALYRNIGKYVFSRAVLEDFHLNGDDDSVISQALKVMLENGSADTKGIGNELGEMLVYTLYAIDNAFDAIMRIENHSANEIKMVEKTALNRFYKESEINFIKQLIIPQQGCSGD